LNQFYKNLALWLVIGLMMMMLVRIFNEKQFAAARNISYTEFLNMVEEERVQEVLIQKQ